MRVIFTLFLALIAIPAFAMGTYPQSALAQSSKKPTTTTVSTNTPPADPLNSVLTQIQNVNSDIIKNTVAALQEADKDAGTIITPAIAATATTSAIAAVVKDPIAHACYPAQIQYLQSLPTAQPITAPAPYNLIVLFQYKRDFVNLILSGQLIPTYLKLGCAPLLGNELVILTATLGLVGIAPAVFAPLSAFAAGLGATAVTLPTISAIVALPK